MKNKNALKLIGTAVSVIGIATTVISDWVDDKKMESLVEEKVKEYISKRLRVKSK